jgi:hypothetical protein
MTADDIAAIVEGLAPVILELIAKAHVETQQQQIAHVIDATKELGAIRERLAVLETRAPVPGPPGAPGKDGVDGLGYDELALEQIDDTTVALKAKRGDTVKAIGSVTFPVLRFKHDYDAGREYLPGHLVRYKSAIWHCGVATMLAPDAVMYDASGKPAGPQGKDCWTLVLSERRR